ncbi:MAG TPA: hypothetical protein VFT92_03650 [Nitrospira sp.]|nr:hypothetical protein [Nitrospira sp.]
MCLIISLLVVSAVVDIMVGADAAGADAVEEEVTAVEGGDKF